MSHKHLITHIELPVNNPKDAANFYQTVFEWNIIEDEQMNYTWLQMSLLSYRRFTRRRALKVCTRARR